MDTSEHSFRQDLLSPLPPCTFWAASFAPYTLFPFLTFLYVEWSPVFWFTSWYPSYWNKIRHADDFLVQSTSDKSCLCRSFKTTFLETSMTTSFLDTLVLNLVTHSVFSKCASASDISSKIYDLKEIFCISTHTSENGSSEATHSSSLNSATFWDLRLQCPV